MDKADYMIGSAIILLLAGLFGLFCFHEAQMTSRCKALIEAGVQDNLVIERVCS